MQYHIRWITHNDADNVMALSKHIYETDKESYPTNLNVSNPNILSAFFVSEDITGSYNRRAIGIFDDNQRLVAATGTRKMDFIPVWVLSWTLSSIKTAQFGSIWQKQLGMLTDDFESQGINEFYVVSPASRELAYKKMMRFMRKRYWTFAELNISAGTKPSHGLHWIIMGNQLYSYDINIRRYILKRGDND